MAGKRSPPDTLPPVRSSAAIREYGGGGAASLREAEKLLFVFEWYTLSLEERTKTNKSLFASFSSEKEERIARRAIEPRLSPTKKAPA